MNKNKQEFLFFPLRCTNPFFSAWCHWMFWMLKKVIKYNGYLHHFNVRLKKKFPLTVTWRLYDYWKMRVNLTFSLAFNKIWLHYWKIKHFSFKHWNCSFFMFNLPVSWLAIPRSIGEEISHPPPLHSFKRDGPHHHKQNSSQAEQFKKEAQNAWDLSSYSTGVKASSMLKKNKNLVSNFLQWQQRQN